MTYRVTLYSISGHYMAQLVLAQAAYSKLVTQVRDGEGFISTERADVPVYDLIPARAIGWINVIEQAGEVSPNEQ